MLIKGEIQLIYKYLELCSSSLGLKKVHNKTTMNDFFALLIIKKILFFLKTAIFF